MLMDTNHNGLIFTTDYEKHADEPEPQESEPEDPDPTSEPEGTDPTESTSAESDPTTTD